MQLGLHGGTNDLTVLGMSFSIYGQDFDLYMYPPAEKAHLWYRTRMFRMKTLAGGVSHIHLGWDEAPPTFVGKVDLVDRDNPRDSLLK